ncbi:unnamed protein product [Protopolystoma xenopodis]|uniref:Uncharacterized protein n=1 Tax=Protopolystoma xenopodis TaxID=117903 RepID=A0A3S5FCU2_9PLAT|nr:unnamed protein product [Protopolystoma xenopodis]
MDPPLSSFPPRSERWMCPLHAEQTIDECLVRSIRLTERMHLWDTLAEAKYDALTTRTGSKIIRLCSAAELAAYQGIVFRRSTRSKIEPATYTEYSTAPGVSLAPLSCPIVDQTSACLDPEATTDSGTDSNAQTDSLVADSSGDEVGDEPGELRCSDEEERERGTVNRDVRVEDTEEEDEQSRNAGHEIEEEENVGAPFINSADEQISDSEDNLLVGVTKPRSVYSPPVQLYQRSSSAMSRARAPTSCAVRNGSGTLNCDSKDRGSATIVEMSSTNLPTGASHDVLYGPDEEAVILADLMHQARRANAVSTALLGLAAIDGRSGHRTIPCSAETAPATSIVRPRPGQDSRGSSHAGYLEASPCVETPRGLWRFHSSTLSAEAGPTLPGAIGLHQEGLQWLTSEQQFIASRVNSSSLRIVVSP